MLFSKDFTYKIIFLTLILTYKNYVEINDAISS